MRDDAMIKAYRPPLTLSNFLLTMSLMTMPLREDHHAVSWRKIFQPLPVITMKEHLMHIVTIGGGGGHAQVLKGLKVLPGLVITGICPSTDSGGSTGALARDYGMPLGYLGDLTKCIAALCPDETLAAALMQRFKNGPLQGHSLKNILMLGLVQTEGMPLDNALRLMEHMCGIAPHRVIPASTEAGELCATLVSGGRIDGETNIDNLAHNPLWSPDIHGIKKIFLQPNVHVWKPATLAILEADHIVICPGDLYSSILPVLLPRGMKDALRNARAKIIVVLNIVTKCGETDGYHAEDIVREIESKMGRRCDVIIYNSTPIPKTVLARYRMERKVRLSTDAFKHDLRLMKFPLLGIAPEGCAYHDPRLLTRAFAKLFAM
jgi:uncharacterized cofD-like protein